MYSTLGSVTLSNIHGSKIAAVIFRTNGNEITLLFRIAPGGEPVVVVGVEAVVALAGVMYRGDDGYLVCRDSCSSP